MADSIRLEQVLTNLIDNSMKYGPGDETIEVDVRQADDDAVRFSVRDHGAGTPAEHRARIFDQFYQIRDSQKAVGMGLGLYVCRHIVELHGGRIDVESPPDGGARFVVAMPASIEKSSIQPSQSGVVHREVQ